MIKCSGCDCPLEVHVKNVLDYTICLTSWTSYNDVHRCDCVNGISKSADLFRAEEERNRKETMAWVDDIVNRIENE
jgi:hypothetical protein